MPLSPPPGPRLCLGPLHPASSVVRLDCPQLSSCPQVLQGCGVATYKLAPGHLAFHRQTDPTHLAQVLCQIRRTHSCPVMTPQLHCHHTLDHTPDTKCYSTSSSPCGSGTGLQMTTRTRIWIFLSCHSQVSILQKTRFSRRESLTCRSTQWCQRLPATAQCSPQGL